VCVCVCCGVMLAAILCPVNVVEFIYYFYLSFYIVFVYYMFFEVFK